MDKTFNELFDDFFKKNNINPSDKLNDNVKGAAKKMIDMLTNSKDIENINEEVEKQIDAELGKPDKVEFYNDGNVFFERRIWNTPNGELIKLVVSDEPFLPIPPVKRDLQKELERALEEEAYEHAAILRDEIEKQKKK